MPMEAKIVLAATSYRATQIGFHLCESVWHVTYFNLFLHSQISPVAPTHLANFTFFVLEKA